MIRVFAVVLLITMGVTMTFLEVTNFSLTSPYPEDVHEDEIVVEEKKIRIVPPDTQFRVIEIGTKEEVKLPGALKVEKDSPGGALTGVGIFFWTNVQRGGEGVRLLSRSIALDEIAYAKLTDMFNRQYFAHVAPSGDDVSDLADNFAYKYLLIGENLALGNFDNDFDVVVNGWMESPGHKKNILNRSYTEIGIAAEEGMFEGREVWLAVQIFGTPMSYCPVVDKGLGALIKAKNMQLDSLMNELKEGEAELEATELRFGAVYGARVDAYNALIGNYNLLLEEVRGLIAIYNRQIQVFNACVEVL